MIPALRHTAGIAVMLILCGPAAAAPETLVLSAHNTLAQTHSQALVLGFSSTYRQLGGILDFDPQARTCHIDIRLVVRSLTAPNALMRAQSMSKTFLDPDDFPETRYVGDCRGGRLVGQLSLRGQTHRFDMAVTFTGTPHDPVAIHAEGQLNRHDWGVNGLAMMVGRTIRITDDISLNGTALRMADP